jgi:hypothetical protein
MSDELKKTSAEMYREFLLFFGVLFFTGVVGIIELLPEFDKIQSIFSWSWLTISLLYFSLLFAINYSIHKCFWILFVEVQDTGKYGFRYPLFESLITKIFKKPKNLKVFMILLVTLLFILLYFVKIGILQ